MTDNKPELLPCPTAAIKNLQECQRQLDMDGIEVGVSRQALTEVLDYIESRAATVTQSDEGLKQSRIEAVADKFVGLRAIPGLFCLTPKEIAKRLLQAADSVSPHPHSAQLTKTADCVSCPELSNTDDSDQAGDAPIRFPLALQEFNLDMLVLHGTCKNCGHEVLQRPDGIDLLAMAAKTPSALSQKESEE